MMEIVLLMYVLQVKHYICDFLFQPPWMWQNKGTLGHPGGIAHAGFHGLVSLAILVYFKPVLFAVVVGLLETVAHYIIDYAKMNINTKQGWKCNQHEQFWVLLGLDQFLHQVTYILIVGFAYL